MRTAETQVLAPADLPALSAALAEATDRTRLLAGGTDLVLALRTGAPSPDLLIDLSGVRELVGVRESGGAVHVGAMTTFAELESHPSVHSAAACLAQAAARIGSQQIRNSATLGGNVANASPCGDSIPTLVALGAQVHVLDSAGEVSVRELHEVVRGAGATGLAPNEVIIGFTFPTHVPGRRSAFAKVGARTVVTVSKLSMAVVVDFDERSDTITSARVALGSVAPAAFREPSLEAVLTGRRADAHSAHDFALACVAAVQRAIPGRASLPYKQHAALAVAYDAWNALALCAPCEPVWPAR